jgi:hypothetical protein
MLFAKGTITVLVFRITPPLPLVFYRRELSRRKFHRNHGLSAVRLFGLPKKLPSDYKHWFGIRWYRVSSGDTEFP